MYRRLVLLFWGLFFVAFTLGCVTSGGGRIESYKPKTTAESEITKCLMDLQEAFNREDLAGCLSHYHKNAQLQTSPSGTMGSKKDYSNRLAELWGFGTRRDYAAPDIKVNGDQAVVKIGYTWEMREARGDTQAEYDMIREGDKWLIMKFKYSVRY